MSDLGHGYRSQVAILVLWDDVLKILRAAAADIDVCLFLQGIWCLLGSDYPFNYDFYNII